MIKLIIVIVILYLTVMVSLFFNIHLITINVFNYISLGGTLASFVGLVFVIIEVLKIKSISAASKLASDKSRTEIISLFFAIDIEKAKKIADEIKNYNRIRKYEFSILRMQELKETLIQLKLHPQYADFVNWKPFITVISVDICSMEKSLSDDAEKCDTAVLNSNLDRILTSLNEIQSKVKYLGG